MYAWHPGEKNMKKGRNILLAVLCTYVLIVVGFEIFVVYMGRSDANRGIAADEEWLTLTTRSSSGEAMDTVVGHVEIDGSLYVAANHWPRSWYNRALATPDIQVTLHGVQSDYRALQLDSAELDRVEQVYQFPFLFRFIAGFPPRRYLKLDPA
ncbi:MAG: hypothetical protein RL120_00460, partial [Gammaproteobacteria bacterium]